MARSYKRDSSGRFAGGGGGSGGGKGKGKSKATAPSKSSAGKSTVAQRKRAMNAQVTASIPLGKSRPGTGKRNPQRERYIGAQNRAAYEASRPAGKGSKAARRAAEVMARSAQATRAKQFSSKSAKNTAARAAYKEAASKYRSTEKMAAGARKNNPSHAAFWNRKAGGAKSGLTRVTNRLTGKTKSRKRG